MAGDAGVEVDDQTQFLRGRRFGKAGHSASSRCLRNDLPYLRMPGRRCSFGCFIGRKASPLRRSSPAATFSLRTRSSYHASFPLPWSPLSLRFPSFPAVSCSLFFLSFVTSFFRVCFFSFFFF